MYKCSATHTHTTYTYAAYNTHIHITYTIIGICVCNWYSCSEINQVSALGNINKKLLPHLTVFGCYGDGVGLNESVIKKENL